MAAAAFLTPLDKTPGIWPEIDAWIRFPAQLVSYGAAGYFMSIIECYATI